MPTLSENDPEPDGRGGPPTRVVAVIVVLHLTGVVGPR
jgi:hypothetical protein